MGTIEQTVLAVLQDATVVMGPREVRAEAEKRLGVAVSQDTVSSSLSVAARDDRSPIARVGKGLYRIDASRAAA